MVELYNGRYRRSRGFLFAFLIAVLWVPEICAQEQIVAVSPANPARFKYGINCSTYQIIEDVLKPDQNLSQILSGYNVAASKIYVVAQKSRPIFDVRKMRAGNPYTLLIDPDVNKTLRYFIYEKNLRRYVVYDLSDPIDVYEGQKPVATELRIAAGVVESSLFETFDTIGLDADLIAPLAEIYAYTIDFHHLRKGDHFVVIFEEDLIDKKSIGINKVVAARFNHRGRDHYAFYQKNTQAEDYFDENGRSLQRAFLKAPLSYTRISSRPSISRLHPILKIRRLHLGTDYAAPHGTPIHSIGDGVVHRAGYQRELGNYLEIRHGSIYKSQYLHLSGFAEGIHSGLRVNRGDIIGYVGSTGLATGPHLDFRFWKNGEIFSHLEANGSEVEALFGDALISFQQRIVPLKKQLDATPMDKEMLVTEYKR